MLRFSFVPALAVAAMSLPAARAATVINGDFSANAAQYVVWPGYNSGTGAPGTNPANPTGWTSTGGVGINPVTPPGAGQDPFNDGTNTTPFAFLQGTATLDQDITGFQIGGSYVLSLDFNARNCCTAGVRPRAEVFLDGTSIANSSSLFPAPGGVIPASVAAGGVWYHANIPFTAADTILTLSIRTTPDTAGGDTTLIVDNISIIPEPGIALLAFSALGGALVRRRR